MWNGQYGQYNDDYYGIHRKLFLSKFITTPLSKTLYVHYKHEMLSYSEIDDSPAPK